MIWNDLKAWLYTAHTVLPCGHKTGLDLQRKDLLITNVDNQLKSTNKKLAHIVVNTQQAGDYARAPYISSGFLLESRGRLDFQSLTDWYGFIHFFKGKMMKYSVLLAALLAVSLSACGKKEEATTTETAPAATTESAAPAAPAAESSSAAPSSDGTATSGSSN